MTVKAVLETEAEAEREVERLNALNAEKAASTSGSGQAPGRNSGGPGDRPDRRYARYAPPEQ